MLKIKLPKKPEFCLLVSLAWVTNTSLFAKRDGYSKQLKDKLSPLKVLNIKQSTKTESLTAPNHFLAYKIMCGR